MNSSELCELFLHPQEEVQEIGRGPSSLTYQVEDIRTQAQRARENGVEEALQEKPLIPIPMAPRLGPRPGSVLSHEALSQALGPQRRGQWGSFEEMVGLEMSAVWNLWGQQGIPKKTTERQQGLCGVWFARMCYRSFQPWFTAGVFSSFRRC